MHFAGIPSLTGTFVTAAPAAAWAVLRLGTRLEIEVFGRDPRSYVLPARAPGMRWASPNPRS